MAKTVEGDFASDRQLAPRGVSLRVGGKEYSGWKTMRVTRGIESVAGGFELSVSDRWAEMVKPWAIVEEDECTVVLSGTRVITGYVDTRNLSFGAKEHTLTVSGRDKTANLVDCSAILDKKWEFNGITVFEFIKKIARPFGINVTLQSGLTDAVLPKPPKKLSVDPGDTALSAIETACRLAGLLPVSDGLGGLLLTRTGTARAKTELVQGENVISASIACASAGRFRHYVVLGQHRATDEAYAEHATTVRGTAEDLNVKRSERVLIIRPEAGVTTEHAKKRAQWEATTRAARADSVSVTVQGWTQADDSLWPVNAVTRCRLPFIGVDGDMLITQLVHTLGEDGTLTQISLKRPDAFKPEPTISTGSTGLWKEIAKGV